MPRQPPGVAAVGQQPAGNPPAVMQDLDEPRLIEDDVAGHASSFHRSPAECRPSSLPSRAMVEESEKRDEINPAVWLWIGLGLIAFAGLLTWGYGEPDGTVGFFFLGGGVSVGVWMWQAL